MNRRRGVVSWPLAGVVFGVFMYFPTLDTAGKLQTLSLTPTRIHRFQSKRATVEQTDWLAAFAILQFQLIEKRVHYR
mgnify:CR=1 FL=1